MDRLGDEVAAVTRWAATTMDPEAATYQQRLHGEQLEMHRRRMTEKRSADKEDMREPWSETSNYRSKWKRVHAVWRDRTPVSK